MFRADCVAYPGQFAIASNQDKRATDILLSTKFVPLPEGGKADVFAMCDRSPVGRAIYDYISDSWQPMPKLTNYSGYDRDSRSFLSAQPTPEEMAEPKQKPTSEQVMSLYREHGKLSPVIAQLWGVHPESDGWDAAKKECASLLGLD